MVDMKNTLGRVARPSFFVRQQHRICGCLIHDAVSSRHEWDCTTAGRLGGIQQTT